MRVLFALADGGFDPTETAVPWEAVRAAGHEVVFATPSGTTGRVDDRLTTGRGFGPLRPFLQASKSVRRVFAEMEAVPAFRKPISFAELRGQRFDGLVLPGGHAPGMRGYLESVDLQDHARAHMESGAPLGAICHGVLVLARAREPNSGRSVLFGRRTTALTRILEMTAFALTCAWLGRYYRTYPLTVQAEVTSALEHKSDFLVGPLSIGRDDAEHLARGFTVRDGNYLSARWPGDAHRFSTDFVAMLAERK